MARRMNANRPSAGRDDLQRLGDDEDRALAVDVGELSRVAGEEQERQDEHHADERELTAGVGLRRRVHGQHRHDDLEQVVVEGAEELRPQERLQSAVPEACRGSCARSWSLLEATIRAGCEVS